MLPRSKDDMERQSKILKFHYYGGCIHCDLGSFNFSKIFSASIIEISEKYAPCELACFYDIEYEPFFIGVNGCMCFAFLVTRTVETTSAGRKIDLFLRHFNNSSLVFSVFCMIESNSKSKNWQFFEKIHFWSKMVKIGPK